MPTQKTKKSIQPMQKIDALYKTLKQECKQSLEKDKKQLAKLKGAEKKEKVALKNAEKKVATLTSKAKSKKVTATAKGQLKKANTQLAKAKAKLKATLAQLDKVKTQSDDTKQHLSQLTAESKQLSAFRQAGKPNTSKPAKAKKKVTKAAKKKRVKPQQSSVIAVADTSIEAEATRELAQIIQEAIAESQELEAQTADKKTQDEQ